MQDIKVILILIQKLFFIFIKIEKYALLSSIHLAPSFAETPLLRDGVTASLTSGPVIHGHLVLVQHHFTSFMLITKLFLLSWPCAA